MTTNNEHAADHEGTLRQAYRTLRAMQRRIDELQDGTVAPVAVIGVGCRFPGGAADPESYWELLRSGRDAVVEVPASRFDVAEFYDPDGGPGRSRTRWGGFLEDIDHFDHAFFGISRREALTMDPQQRVALEVAWHAFEDAGMATTEVSGSRTGVYLGVSSYDYATESSGDPADITAYSSSGTAHSVVPGRISYVLNLTGPAMSIDTACSSSLVAIHQACQALRARECDLALGGGVNVVLSPLPAISFSQFGMMSRDGRARTFDAAADGCVRGEGGGVVVLKRLDDALRDGDRVLALIRGGAVNQDGRSSGFTAPNGRSQRECIRAALRSAGVAADTVSYIEAHGTGTPLGDPIEVDALADIYGRAGTPCYLGSAKTVISHLEAAAGVAGLVKTVLALHRGEITPNLHFNELNPHISFTGTSFAVPTEVTGWPQTGAPRRAAVSAFGFSGTNAHLVLEQAPPPAERRPPAAERPTSVLTLSAASGTALGAVAARYQARLADGSADTFADLCASAATGRAHLARRLAVVATDREDAADQLERFVEGWPADRLWTGQAQADEVTFVFSGQGAQYPGMAAELLRTSPTFREAMLECQEILAPLLERPLLEVVAADADEGLVHAIEYAQPALFAVEYSLARMWRSWGVEPAAVMGHSLGEIVAACVAGVYDLRDALTFVAERGRLLSQLPDPGRMAAVKVSPDDLAEQLQARPGLTVAAVNSPTSVTVSGSEADIDAICAHYTERDVLARKLDIGAAGHSPLVEPILAPLLAAARRMTARTPQLPVVSNLTGELWSWTEPPAPEYWCEHVRRTVQFAAGVATVRDLGQRTFLEIGPAPRLLGLMSECLAGTDDVRLLPTLRAGRPDWEVLLASLAQLYVRGADLDWGAVHEAYTSGRVPLPLYPFDRTACPVVRAPRRDAGAPDARRAAADLAEGSADGPADDDLLYDVRWHEQPAAPAAGTDAGTAGRRWVAVTRDPQLAQALATAVAPDPCSTVAPGDPLPDGDGPLEVVLLPVESQPAETLPAETLQTETETAPAEEELVTGLLLDAVRTAACAGATPGARLWFVTQGGVVTDDGDAAAARPEQALWWGLGRSLEQEASARWGGLVDLAPGTDVAGQLAGLVPVVRSGPAEDQVALRGGRTLVPRVEPTTTAAAAVRLRPDAAYLVTGGFGGLGLATAASLARAGARRLVLLGRTPVPPRAEWAALDADGDAGRRVAAVTELERLGASVQAVCLDVADEDAVRDWYRRYRAELRAPIAGIVHAAGAGELLPLADISPEAARRAVHAKAVGAGVLARTLATPELDFLVFYSSLGSVLSSPFSGAYAAANAYLDTLAPALRSRGVPATAVNWGLWPRTGMSAEQRTGIALANGLHVLDPDQALRLLHRVAAGTSPQVVVTHVDWAVWGPEYERASRSPVLRSLLTGSPRRGKGRAAVELPTRAELEARPPADRTPFLTGRTVEAVAAILQTDVDKVSTGTALLDLGMDSLMAVELRNQLEVRLGVAVPVATFLGGASIADLVTTICAHLTPQAQAQEQPATAPGIRRQRRDDAGVAQLIEALGTGAGDRETADA